MNTLNLENVLEGFNPGSPKAELKAGRPVTLWLPESSKSDYDTLQELSKGSEKRFSELLREVACAVIEKAKSKALNNGLISA